MTEVVRSSQTAAPTATSLLTFLIADVRGYTRFTVERGDEAAARLADRFAGLCENILAAHDGKVIELRGDEALAVFSSARNALRGAVALQQAFKQAVLDDPLLPLTVGMGLDAGEPIPVRGGYRGGALNLAARLCSIAGAGEILASETVIGLARKTEGLAFVDRGQVTLKGLTAPVRVLQIAPEGELPAELPPLQPILVTHPTNLPDEPTPFIGREGEIGQVVRLLRDPHIRLVTLTGPGGTGKTRLALQVGSTLLHDFADGVFFCDLSQLSDPALVSAAIAEVLGIVPEAETSMEEQLRDVLAAKHLLLVLDNFEHLLDAAGIVGTLLAACRELHVLVTSRIPLHLEREQEHAVPPLEVPDPHHLPDLTILSRYESVALFIQRARAARDSFAITDENAPAVADICARLDGLPLAIELAAARIKLFPPQALLQRLTSRLKLLTGGARDKPTRQQTLRGAIDWSYSLLTEDEQALFARLAVFPGGCTFEAAETVCNDTGEIDVLDGMASLVDKSLVRQEGEDEPRFGMLETIREYAAEKLAERREELPLRGAFARYFLEFGEQAEAELYGPRHEECLRRITAEVTNVRAAVHHFLDGGEVEEALRLVAALASFWAWRVHRVDAERWLDDALARKDAVVRPSVRGKALLARAIVEDVEVHPREAATLLEQALLLLREAGDRRGVDHVLGLLSRIAGLEGRYEEATAYQTEALARARELGDRIAVCQLLGSMGWNWLQRREYAVARHHFEEALSAACAMNHPFLIANAVHGCAHVSEEEGDYAAAERDFEEALALFRDLGETRQTALLLYDLGTLFLAGGQLDRAAPFLEECLALFSDLRRSHWVACTLGSLGALALQQGDLGLARARLHESLVMLCDLGDDEFTPDILGFTAALAAECGDLRRAGQLLGCRAALRAGNTLPPKPPLWRANHRPTVQRVRAALGEEAWQRTQAEGAAMTLEQAVVSALEATAPPGRADPMALALRAPQLRLPARGS